MKVFVAGPMTGYDNHNFPEFERVEIVLREKGMRPISLRQLIDVIFGGRTDLPSEEYMIAAIDCLGQADAICLLDGWEESNNASAEAAVALALKLFFVSKDGEVIRPPSRVCVHSDGYLTNGNPSKTKTPSDRPISENVTRLT